MINANNMTNDTKCFDPDENQEEHTFQILGVLLATIMVSSVVFNAYAFQHVIRQRGNGQKFVNVIMASLFVSNFFMAGLGYPIGVLSMTNIDKKVLLSHSYCQFSAYTVFATSVVSIAHVVILSLHRYIQFSRPVLARTVNRKRRPAILIVLTTWVLCFCSAALPLLGWGRFARSGYTCSIDFRQNTLGSYTYIAYTMLMFYVTPLVILISTRVGITVRHANSFGRWPMQLQRRYANMESAMLIGFLVCWSPYASVGLTTLLSVKVSFQIEQACAVFAKLSALMNSVIYCFVYQICRKRTNANPADKSMPRTKQTAEDDLILQHGSVHHVSVNNVTHQSHDTTCEVPSRAIQDTCSTNKLCLIMHPKGTGNVDISMNNNEAGTSMISVSV